MNKDNSFAERAVAFACFEGILLRSSSCAAYRLKKRGLLPGLVFSNDLIAHVEACKPARYLMHGML